MPIYSFLVKMSGFKSYFTSLSWSLHSIRLRALRSHSQSLRSLRLRASHSHSESLCSFELHALILRCIEFITYSVTLLPRALIHSNLISKNLFAIFYWIKKSFIFPKNLGNGGNSFPKVVWKL